MRDQGLFGVFSGPSLEDRLVAARYRPAGFDYMRIILSSAVIVSHSINVSYGVAYTLAFWTPTLRPLAAMVLTLFFALSGFLVASSLERCKTSGGFTALRALRLVPALAVEIVLSAVVIGIFFTTLPLGQYFTDPLFFNYLLNIVGIVHYFLPGVFADNPWPRLVNGQLWTLPYEIYAYATLALLFLIGVARKERWFLTFVIVLNVGLFIFYYVIRKTTIGITLNGPLLLLCFFYGIVLYQYRRKIVWSAGLFILSTIATYVCFRFEIGNYLAPIPAAYMAVYLGLLEPRKIWLVSSGDYSYGLYLYGYPIQQAVVATMGPAGQHWWVNSLVSWPLAFLCAYGSWRFVEAKAMNLKPWIARQETEYLARREAALARGDAIDQRLARRWARFQALPRLQKIGLAAFLLALVGVATIAVLRRKNEPDFALIARVAVINAHIGEAPPGYILVAGDSNAEMVSPAIRMCGRELVNGGIAGSRIKDYVERWRLIGFSQKPSAILVSIGTNDLHRKRNPLRSSFLADFEREAETLARQALSVSPHVFVMAVPPAERTMTAYEPGAVVAFSQRLERVCARLGCTFIDPFAEAREGNTGLAKPGATRDGIHVLSYRKAMAGIEPQVCGKL